MVGGFVLFGFFIFFSFRFFFFLSTWLLSLEISLGKEGEREVELMGEEGEKLT
jgi:hypothetical protein